MRKETSAATLACVAPAGAREISAAAQYDFRASLRPSGLPA
jgi:hypothetical protein